MSSSTNEEAIVIERTFKAPRELVFRHWIEAENVASWFAPEGYTVTSCSVDAKTGGSWRVHYRSDKGDEAHIEEGQFEEVTSPSKLVFTLTQKGERTGTPGPKTLVTVEFGERSANETHMTFRQTGFTDKAMREGNAGGWKECFKKLDRNLDADREIRALFQTWSDASSRKDLDGSMAPIHPNVESYEHEMPLQIVRDTGKLREICKKGFDAAPPGNFRWDVPNLRIIVRGDIAVTWGLNHMHVVGSSEGEMWSRGTRIFQRVDGAWKMIHQHVSFPFDPESGKVRFDLKP